MEPTIVSKDAFSVIGLELKTTTRDGKNLIEIPPSWEQLLAADQIDRIHHQIKAQHLYPRA